MASHGDPISRSRYELAELVLQILDRTYKLDSPDLTSNGGFVFVKLPLTLGQLPVVGLNDPVAWMYAVCHDPIFGQMFISLCGSIHNYIGFAGIGDEDQTLDGWYPSSSAGLHAIIERLSEESGDLWKRGEWERLIENPHETSFFYYLSALTHVEDIYTLQNTDVEVLAKIFFFAKNVKLDGPRTTGHFDTVIAGAPIWVRSHH
jgi:hypothetical protein